MTKRKNEIIEAEFTPVPEPSQEQPQAVFNLEDVAEMVMVGRLKDGTEFVQPFGFDDALKAKAYSDYGSSYFNILIEKAIWDRMKGGN